MAAFDSESACSCSIDAARHMLEASGFMVSQSSALLRQSESASEKDEVFTLYCTIAAVLVLIAGLMSGLTLGLMSLDTLDLEVCQAVRKMPRPNFAANSMTKQSCHLLCGQKHSFTQASNAGPTEKWDCTRAEVCKSNRTCESQTKI